MTGPANRYIDTHLNRFFTFNNYYYHFRTYLWFDEKGKKTRVAAPQYIDYVMTFTQKTVSDESIFPTKYANEFPSSFESIARKILRLLFHVIAHLYAAHFKEIALLGLHTHLNLTFAHLTALHRRFGLIEEKETDVLRDLEVALRLTDDSVTTTPGVGSSLSGTSAGAMDMDATGVYCNTIVQNANNSQTINSAASNIIIDESSSCFVINSSNSTAVMMATSTTTNLSTTVIDGDAETPPICTQPEAVTKTEIFGGAGGLVGGILGDLSSGEFGDTLRYCTSAIPSSAAASTATADAASSNNGAGALHLNFNNNNNNNNHHHHHHHHHPHTHHVNSGLIQCNSTTAPSSASSATNSAASASANTSTA